MPAASGKMCRKLTSSLGSYQGCITPTRTPPTPLSLSQHLCFIPSHIRASHNLTTTTDTTIRTSHPRSSYPLLIFTLNLVLLSGLRLNIPSEISYFKKDSWAAGAANAVRVQPSQSSLARRLKRLRDSKQNQVSWSSDKLSYWEGAFAKTLCDMIQRQSPLPHEYGCNCLCLSERKSSTYLTGKYLCKNLWVLLARWALYLFC